MSARFNSLRRNAGILLLFAGSVFIVYLLSAVRTSPRENDVEAFAVGRNLAKKVSTSLHPDNILFRKECVRCHGAPAPDSFPYELSCVKCHQQIFAGEFDTRFSRQRIDKWKSRIEHLLLVPDFESISLRLKPEWVREFLNRPSTARPHLGAMMPKIPLEPNEIEDIITVLYSGRNAPAAATYEGGSPSAGGADFRRYGCGDCHRFLEESGIASRTTARTFRDIPDGVRLAPDLRDTRKRMSRAAAAQWIRQPGGTRAKSLMPSYQLSEEETRDLIAFLFDHPLDESPKKPVFNPLPLLERTVSYQEVEQRVTKRICWHCHSDPIPMLGEGGPGNTGGLGFGGAGLDLGSYEGILRGSTKRDEGKRSIIERESDGVPRLVKHLLARHREIQGEFDPEHIGMPLGLPPLPAEDIQLIWSWIEQGAKK